MTIKEFRKFFYNLIDEKKLNINKELLVIVPEEGDDESYKILYDDEYLAANYTKDEVIHEVKYIDIPEFTFNLKKLVTPDDAKLVPKSYIPLFFTTYDVNVSLDSNPSSPRYYLYIYDLSNSNLDNLITFFSIRDSNSNKLFLKYLDNGICPILKGMVIR